MRSIASLFRGVTDGACGIDRDQRIVFWNHGAEAILEYDAADVLGRHCHEVFRAKDKCDRVVCQRECPIFRLIRGAKAAPTQIVQIKRNGGAPIWLRLGTIAIPSHWNAEAVLVHLFHDVSHMKTCEAAVEHLIAEVAHAEGGPEDGGTPVGECASTPSTCLTCRESEVLRLLAAGRSTRKIADTLYVSTSTVRNHLHNIYSKLDVHSRIEALIMAQRFGML